MRFIPSLCRRTLRCVGILLGVGHGHRPARRTRRSRRSAVGTLAGQGACGKRRKCAWRPCRASDLYLRVPACCVSPSCVRVSPEIVPHQHVSPAVALAGLPRAQHLHACDPAGARPPLLSRLAPAAREALDLLVAVIVPRVRASLRGARRHALESRTWTVVVLACMLPAPSPARSTPVPSSPRATLPHPIAN